MLTSEENIFELLGNSCKVYHSAIISSFTFDPYYFSNYYMPQMRSRGIKNIIVLIDSTQYDAILEDAETFKVFNHDFALIRVQNKTSGIFHPKVSLFIGEKQALAIVGSGNLTYSGMSHNKELWGAFCVDNKDATEAVIVKDIWDYLSKFIKSSNSKIAIQQLEWSKIYSDIIKELESIELPQQKEFKFIVAKTRESIFNQIKEIINTDVDTIKIIAPFYDSDGSFICHLKNTFNPQTIKCAIEESYGLIPHLITELNDIQFYHWNEIFKTNDQFDFAKKLHAKAIQFETSNGNYLVFGSANATSSAFGLNPHCFNDEANIIIHSFKEDFFKNLGIDFNRTSIKSIENVHHTTKYKLKTTNKNLLTHITLCERHLDNKLYVSFDKIILGVKIRLFLNQKYIDLDYNNDGINVNGLDKIQYIVAVLNDNEISNKVIVLDFADLMKRNPDSKFKQIESLFYSNDKDWDDNIAKILSYVTFDVKDKNYSTNVSKKTLDTSRKSEIIINKSQFENTRFAKNPDINLNTLNMRILDQIQFFNSTKQEDADEIDESVSMEDLVVGNYNDNSYKRSKHKTYTNKHEILSYLKRLKQFYNNLAEAFDNQDPFYRLQSQGIHFQNNITCNDYSYILIALTLIFQRIAHPIEGDHNSSLYKLYFAELMGRFMMIYRVGYPKTNDFTYTKLEEMHHNFFVYSLLILSTCNMNNEHIEVWTLNLLETYNNDYIKIQSFYNEYLNLANQYKSIIKEYNCIAIKNALEKYFNFLKRGRNIVSISESDNNFYFHRTNFGFIFCKKISKVTHKHVTYYNFEVIYPGIKDMSLTYTNNQTKVNLIK